MDVSELGFWARDRSPVCIPIRTPNDWQNEPRCSKYLNKFELELVKYNLFIFIIFVTILFINSIGQMFNIIFL